MDTARIDGHGELVGPGPRQLAAKQLLTDRSNRDMNSGDLANPA